MATLTQFLKQHSSTSKKDSHLVTHTRIPDKENNIYAGSYIIPADKELEFYDLVYNEIIIGNKIEYLTEKQHKDGVIYIDLDFKYSYDVTSRQHTKEIIQNLICEAFNIISELMIVKNSQPIDVYVMQKDGVNRLNDCSLTKDGIHIIIGLNMPNKLQLELRKRLINIAKEDNIFETMPLINTFESIFDEGLPKGTTNCQLYGCRKPSHDAYKLVYICKAEIDNADGEWMLDFQNAPKITKDLFLDLCVRYNKNRVNLELTQEGIKINNPVVKQNQQSNEQ